MGQFASGWFSVHRYNIRRFQEVSRGEAGFGGGYIMEVAPKFPAMAALRVRKEVHEFVQAAEFLLSPALQTPALTDDECVIIAEYVTTLSHAKQPWGKSLVIRYA